MLLTGSLMPALADAAENGTVGATSKGNLVIHLSINEGVQIANLDDLNVETTRDQVQGNLKLTEPFCIKGNLGSQFQISASTNVLGGSQFALIGDQGDALNYHVDFFYGDSEGDGENLKPGTPSQTRTIDKLFDCSTGNNVSIEVIFEEADILSSLSTEYTGILFITVQLV